PQGPSPSRVPQTEPVAPDAHLPRPERPRLWLLRPRPGRRFGFVRRTGLSLSGAVFGFVRRPKPGPFGAHIWVRSSPELGFVRGPSLGSFGGAPAPRRTIPRVPGTRGAC